MNSENEVSVGKDTKDEFDLIISDSVGWYVGVNVDYNIDIDIGGELDSSVDVEVKIEGGKEI